jgi:hypothetical protein
MKPSAQPVDGILTGRTRLAAVRLRRSRSQSVRNSPVRSGPAAVLSCCTNHRSFTRGAAVADLDDGRMRPQHLPRVGFSHARLVPGYRRR